MSNSKMKKTMDFNNMIMDPDSCAISAVEHLCDLYVKATEMLEKYQPFSDPETESENFYSMAYPIKTAIMNAIYRTCANYYNNELEYQKENP